MTTIERMARAMWALREKRFPAFTQQTWEQGIDLAHQDALTMAACAFDILTARPSAEVIAAGAAAMKERTVQNYPPSFFLACAEAGFEAMIRAMGEGK